MGKSMKAEPDKRERITILSLRDIEVSYFCGSGKGGQARNKVASGVMMRHAESGAIGRASDSRSQDQNKRAAWERLVKTPQMKFWLAKKVFEIRQGETLEQSVENDMRPENLKIEVRNENGQWHQVTEDYFKHLKEVES